MRLLLMVFISLVWMNQLSAQALPCDGSFYLIMQVDGQSVLQHLRLDDNQSLQKRNIPLSYPQRRYSCLGMSLEDLHLYALDFHTKELLRINAEGQVTNLGVPDNLDTSLEYWAGDVMPEGRRLFVVGRNPATGIDDHVYTINLSTDNHYAGSTGLVSNLPTTITDVANDPIRGVMYGYDLANRQIVVIGTSSITHHNHQRMEPMLESLFFDQLGHLYAYGSDNSIQEQTTLYAIDKVKGGATPLATGQRGSFGDGCSCPQTIQFSRSVLPNRLLPCTEVTIDYHITNHAGIGKTGVVFEDLLPPEFTITEVTEHTFTLATIEEGVGGSRLYIPNLDVLLGENIIRIKAFVDATPARTYTTQASLDNLPMGLGSRLLSDNLLTPEPADPNLIEILEVGEVDLKDYLIYNCSSDTAILSLPFDAHTYRWSDGSDGPVLYVTEPGQYWVEAVGNCQAVSDTIVISDFPAPLTVDLGADQQVKEGSLLQLPFITNFTSPQQLRWTSSGDFDLSCRDCEVPSLTATQSNTYYLELADPFGCSVTDSIHITVLPARNIYAANVFSPNGDGINDHFYLQGPGVTAEILHLRIFNRWGVAVFVDQGGRINSMSHGWDGRYRGQPVASGTYFWTAVLAFPDGQVIDLSGTVLIIRD